MLNLIGEHLKSKAFLLNLDKIIVETTEAGASVIELKSTDISGEGIDSEARIISSVEELVESFNAGKDMVHVAVFGVEGYKKVINGTFDSLLDFPKIENDNHLLNLKIAFFSTIYGLTYNQAEKLIKNFDSFMQEYNVNFSENDRLIYETIVAMRSLYNLTLEDQEEIDLYREVYYKYIKKNGIYSSVEIEALVLMEGLMRRMYNNSIEIL